MIPEQMRYVFTRECVRQLDALAIERYGIPGIVLMENASRQLAQHTISTVQDFDNPKALILCGGGNNGGDGFGAARHLHNAGFELDIVLLHPIDKYDGDARTNLDILQAMKLNLIETDGQNPLETLHDLPTPKIVVDAMLGTGLKDKVRSPYHEVIDWLNHLENVIVIAADIPSGLDCDTGEPNGISVVANHTVTFAGLKKGFQNFESLQYTGLTTVADIGAPKELVKELAEVL